MKISSNTKIFIVAPANIVSGGPESLHQLTNKLSQLGLNAYIYYYNSSNSNFHEEYKNYKLKMAHSIDDNSNNVLIVPEIYTHILYYYNHIQKCIWWLSLNYYFPASHNDNYVRNYKLIFFIKYIKKKIRKFISFFIKRKKKFFTFGNDKNEIFHFYNCNYIKDYLLKNGIREENTLYLCGPLSEVFFEYNKKIKKENIIAYNSAKGFHFTQKIINKAKELNLDMNFVQIKNMSTKEVADLLARAKMYIDFGNFPGPERIPREAVIMKTNILTSDIGSAQNKIDVPILNEFKFSLTDENIIKIIKKIEEILENYEYFLPMYDEYRAKVYNQLSLFDETIKYFFKSVNNK